MAIPSWNRNASSTDLEILTAEGLDLSGTIRQSEVVYGSARYSETRSQDISVQDVVDDMTDRGIEITSNQDILDHASDMFTDMDDWEYDDDIDSMEINRPDFFEETAETVIPIQTYVIWSIWIDLGYNVDAYEEIGFSSIEVSDMEKGAQYQLFKIAEDILREFVYGDDDGFR